MSRPEPARREKNLHARHGPSFLPFSATFALPAASALVRLLEILGFGAVALSEPVEAKQVLAAGFGADILVDLLKENIAMHTVQGGGYETVFECSGAPCAVPDAMSCCADRSTVCIVSMIMRNIEITPWCSMVLNFKKSG